MGMAAPSYYTADMVRALPDDRNHYETVHGELLVTPAPRVWHQIVLERLHPRAVAPESLAGVSSGTWLSDRDYLPAGGRDTSWQHERTAS